MSEDNERMPEPLDSDAARNREPGLGRDLAKAAAVGVVLSSAGYLTVRFLKKVFKDQDQPIVIVLRPDELEGES